MEIHIWLDERTPPAGRLRCADPDARSSRTVAFTGWLGLLRALDQVIRQPDGPPEGE